MQNKDVYIQHMKGSLENKMHLFSFNSQQTNVNVNTGKENL